MLKTGGFFSLRRLVSLAVLVSFFSTQIVFPASSFAVPAASSITPAFNSQLLKMELSKDLGQLDELYIPSGADTSGKLIAFVQDAHANTQAQRSIEGILEKLTTSFGPDTLVALEGAKDRLEPQNLQVFSDPKLNEALAQDLLEKGELTGAELFALKNPDKAQYIGVDSPELYRENVASYRKTYGLRPESLEWLSGINTDLKELKNRLFTKELKTFDKARESFHKEILSTYDYLLYLSKWSLERAVIDLNDPMNQKDFPILTRILALKRTASQISGFETKLKTETNQLIQALKEGRVSDTLISPLKDLANSLPKGGSRQYFEDLFIASLSSKRPIDWNNYPTFRIFTEYSILQEEIDGVRFFTEIRSLEDLILSNLGLGDRERQVLALSQDTVILERLLKLEASKEELEYYTAHKDSLDQGAVEKRLKTITSQFTGFKHKASKTSLDPKKVEEAFKSAEDFYQFATLRDQALLTNTLKTMDENKLTKAILITGGFHSQGIRRLLRDQKISYVLISPRIQSEFTTEKYERIMMGDITPAPAKTGQYQKVPAALLTNSPGNFSALEPENISRQSMVIATSGLTSLIASLTKPISLEVLNRELERLQQHPMWEGMVKISPVTRDGKITTLMNQGLYTYQLNFKTGNLAGPTRASVSGASLGRGSDQEQIGRNKEIYDVLAEQQRYKFTMADKKVFYFERTGLRRWSKGAEVQKRIGELQSDLRKFETKDDLVSAAAAADQIRQLREIQIEIGKNLQVLAGRGTVALPERDYPVFLLYREAPDPFKVNASYKQLIGVVGAELARSPYQRGISRRDAGELHVDPLYIDYQAWTRSDPQALQNDMNLLYPFIFKILAEQSKFDPVVKRLVYEVYNSNLSHAEFQQQYGYFGLEPVTIPGSPRKILAAPVARVLEEAGDILGLKGTSIAQIQEYRVEGLSLGFAPVSQAVKQYLEQHPELGVRSILFFPQGRDAAEVRENVAVLPGTLMIYFNKDWSPSGLMDYVAETLSQKAAAQAAGLTERDIQSGIRANYQPTPQTLAKPPTVTGRSLGYEERLQGAIQNIAAQKDKLVNARALKQPVAEDKIYVGRRQKFHIEAKTEEVYKQLKLSELPISYRYRYALSAFDPTYFKPVHDAILDLGRMLRLDTKTDVGRLDMEEAMLAHNRLLGHYERNFDTLPSDEQGPHAAASDLIAPGLTSVDQYLMLKFVWNYLVLDLSSEELFAVEKEYYATQLVNWLEKGGKPKNIPGVVFYTDLHGGPRLGELLAFRMGLKDWKGVTTPESFEKRAVKEGLDLSALNLQFIGGSDYVDRGPKPYWGYLWNKWLRDKGLLDFIPGNHEFWKDWNILGLHKRFPDTEIDAEGNKNHALIWWSREWYSHGGWAEVFLNQINEARINDAIGRLNAWIEQHPDQASAITDRLMVDPELVKKFPKSFAEYFQTKYGEGAPLFPSVDFKTLFESDPVMVPANQKIKETKKTNQKIREKIEIMKKPAEKRTPDELAILETNKDLPMEQLEVENAFPLAAQAAANQFKELQRIVTELNKALNLQIPLPQTEYPLLTPENYRKDPILLDGALWDLENANLIHLDEWSWFYSHGIIPFAEVRDADGNVRGVRLDVEYRNLKGIEAIDRMQYDIRRFAQTIRLELKKDPDFLDSDRFWKFYENDPVWGAFKIINRWYSDKLATLKTKNVKKLLAQGGFAAMPLEFSEALSFTGRHTIRDYGPINLGHLEPDKLAKEKVHYVEAPRGQKPYKRLTLIHADYEMSQGGAVNSLFAPSLTDPDQIEGFRRYGFEITEKQKDGKSVKETAKTITDITASGLPEDQKGNIQEFSSGSDMARITAGAFIDAVLETYGSLKQEALRNGDATQANLYEKKILELHELTLRLGRVYENHLKSGAYNWDEQLTHIKRAVLQYLMELNDPSSNKVEAKELPFNTQDYQDHSALKSFEDFLKTTRFKVIQLTLKGEGKMGELAFVVPGVVADSAFLKISEIPEGVLPALSSVGVGPSGTDYVIFVHASHPELNSRRIVRQLERIFMEQRIHGPVDPKPLVPEDLLELYKNLLRGDRYRDKLPVLSDRLIRIDTGLLKLEDTGITPEQFKGFIRQTEEDGGQKFRERLRELPTLRQVLASRISVANPGSPEEQLRQQYWDYLVELQKLECQVADERGEVDRLSGQSLGSVQVMFRLPETDVLNDLPQMAGAFKSDIGLLKPSPTMKGIYKRGDAKNPDSIRSLISGGGAELGLVAAGPDAPEAIERLLDQIAFSVLVKRPEYLKAFRVAMARELRRPLVPDQSQPSKGTIQIDFQGGAGLTVKIKGSKLSVELSGYQSIADIQYIKTRINGAFKELISAKPFDFTPAKGASLGEGERTAVTVTDEDFQELLKLREQGLAGFHKNIDPNPVIPAPENAVTDWGEISPIDRERFIEKEKQMYRNNEITLVVMAGGEATRFGGPKTFVEVSPELGEFLEIKAANLRWLRQTFGTSVPYYLLSSEKRLADFKKALEGRNYYGMSPDDFPWYVQGTVDTFIPTDQEIEANFKGADVAKYKGFTAKLRAENPDGIYRFKGERRKIPAGHFDALASFIISGRYSEALEKGVKYAVVANIDNLQAVLKNDGKIAHFAEQNKDFGFLLAEKNLTYKITQKATGRVLVDKLQVRFRDNAISFDGLTESPGQAEKDGIRYVINRDAQSIDVFEIATGQRIETEQKVKPETGGTLVQPVHPVGLPFGKPIMKEGFELSPAFPHEKAPFFNTNTQVVALLNVLKFLGVTQEQLAVMTFDERSVLVREKLVKQIKPNFEFKNHEVDGAYPEIGIVGLNKERNIETTKIPVSQLTRIMLQTAHIKGVDVEYYFETRANIFAPVKEPEEKAIAAVNNRESLKAVTIYPVDQTQGKPSSGTAQGRSLGKLDELLKLLKSEKEIDRQLAAVELVALANKYKSAPSDTPVAAQEWEKAIPDLIEVLKDKNTYVREYMMDILSILGEPAVLPLTMLVKDEEVGPYAVQTLIKIGPSVLPALLREMDGADEFYLEGLEVVFRGLFPEDEQALTHLIAALDHEDPDIRDAASAALMDIGSDAVPALLTALNDEKMSARLRSHAATTLGVIGISSDPEMRQQISAVFNKILNQFLLSSDKDLGMIASVVAEAKEKIATDTKETTVERVRKGSEALARKRGLMRKKAGLPKAQKQVVATDVTAGKTTAIFLPDTQGGAPQMIYLPSAAKTSMVALGLNMDTYDRDKGLEDTAVVYDIYQKPNEFPGKVEDPSNRKGYSELQFDQEKKLQELLSLSISDIRKMQVPWLEDFLKEWFKAQQGKSFSKDNPSLTPEKPAEPGEGVQGASLGHAVQKVEVKRFQTSSGLELPTDISVLFGKGLSLNIVLDGNIPRFGQAQSINLSYQVRGDETSPYEVRLKINRVGRILSSDTDENVQMSKEVETLFRSLVGKNWTKGAWYEAARAIPAETVFLQGQPSVRGSSLGEAPLTDAEKSLISAAETVAGSFISLDIQDNNPTQFEKFWQHLFSGEIQGGEAVIYLAEKAALNSQGPLAQLAVRNRQIQDALVVSSGKVVSKEAIVTETLLNPKELAVIVEEPGGLKEEDLENFVRGLTALSGLQKRQVLNQTLFIKVPQNETLPSVLSSIAAFDGKWKVVNERLSRLGIDAAQVLKHISVTADSATLSKTKSLNPKAALSFIAAEQLKTPVPDEGAYRFLNYSWASTLAFYGGADLLPEDLKRYLKFNEKNQLILNDLELAQYLQALSADFEGYQKVLQAA